MPSHAHLNQKSQESSKHSWNTIKPEPSKPRAFSTHTFFFVTAFMTALPLNYHFAYMGMKICPKSSTIPFFCSGRSHCLACFIGYLVSRSLTRPISSLTNTAFQIRNGDLSARSGVRGSDELGRLGRHLTIWRLSRRT